MKNSNPEDKIILAIDGLELKESLSLIKKCPRIKWVKIGLELFSREGPDAIKAFKDINKSIFLDLKFHDIPNTMKSACYQVSRSGVDIISVHASAGSKALSISKQASIEGASDSNLKPPALIGITVLTSFSSLQFQNEFDSKTLIEDYVLRLARLSFDSGLDGCVCSPLEVKNLRSNFGSHFQLITPGIRFDNSNNNDQSRVMSAHQAISRGATKLVIGRPITRSSDPNKSFNDICKSIS